MTAARPFDARIFRDDTLGFTLDLSEAPAEPAPGIERAIAAMVALEAGAIANADEGRRVGHYWLRAPERAPEPAISAAVRQSYAEVEALALDDHTDVLLIGIGGSALGPQLLSAALAQPTDRARLHFLDNTDPEGILSTLSQLDPARTLCLVASKSGGTIETRNGMVAAIAWVEAAGLQWAPRAIAITTPGSALDRRAVAEGWRARLPLWDWVGGRTSVTGAVGLAPMALAGWDWRGLLAGAAAMDDWCRQPAAQNPAAQLAMAWFQAGAGRGDRALVIEPYRDRLSLVGRYLQQLVMESLGKRLDRSGAVVHQGLTVYGNKGSTDQHAFMQQVRDGRDDCFVHFIDTAAAPPRVPVGDGLFADDHLLGFLLGTRAALTEAGRPSVTITLSTTAAPSLGALISIFERAVGLYAELINVNAYHQPGVEAGKLGASRALTAMAALQASLTDEAQTAAALAARLDVGEAVAWRLLEHLSATGRARRIPGARPHLDAYGRP